MPDPESDTTIEAISSAVGSLMDDAWVDYGYTAPNTEVYPWLWLWDSCFHTLIWADLDRPDRAVAELACVLELQDNAGFVPHMGYQLDPQVPVELEPAVRVAEAADDPDEREDDVPATIRLRPILRLDFPSFLFSPFCSLPELSFFNT